MKALPIGQQDFRKIREQGKLYIDKTELIVELTRVADYIFLSRPRRFGKSLTLSTLKALFEGRRDLFEGLWAAENYNWEQQYPVVHLQFNQMNYRGQTLSEALIKELDNEAKAFGVTLTGGVPSERFRSLLTTLHKTRGRVVVLIDEYDKPLIDYLGGDEIEQAREHQRQLKSFYSVIKSSDAYLRFFMITGVSKFSKVGVFSDLNNLYDVSTTNNFATLTGITEAEIDRYLADRIPVDRDKLRLWYNGYTFAQRGERVYNPFSLLSFFADGTYSNYWFATGTPTFLIKLLREREIYDLAARQVSVFGFNSYDLNRLETIPLLFQTGYLTIKSYDEELNAFDLGYPNLEVKESMLRYLLAEYTHREVERTVPYIYKLRAAFLEGDLDQIRTIINDLFQTIPYQLFTNAKENLYHAVVHLMFTYLGQYVQSEVSSLRGRLDSMVVVGRRAYLFEFKLDGSTGEALDQIKNKNYRASLPPSVSDITAIGVNFSGESKTVEGWSVETLTS